MTTSHSTFLGASVAILLRCCASRNGVTVILLEWEAKVRVVGDGVKKALTAEEHMLERYGTTYGRVGNDDTRGAAAAVAPVA